jgi:hypothetical protein
MYSKYSDVSLKNGMWRKIWIRDNEGILMMFEKKHPKKWSKRRFSENRTTDFTVPS